jgi:hypothetical protein
MIANFSCENIVLFLALIDARMTAVALAQWPSFYEKLVHPFMR